MELGNEQVDERRIGGMEESAAGSLQERVGGRLAQEEQEFVGGDARVSLHVYAADETVPCRVTAAPRTEHEYPRRVVAGAGGPRPSGQSRQQGRGAGQALSPVAGAGPA